MTLLRVAIHDAARACGVPITMRGAGTSVAGNAVGPGIVVDTVKHLTRVLEIDPERATRMLVEAGRVAWQDADLPGVIEIGWYRAP